MLFLSGFSKVGFVENYGLSLSIMGTYIYWISLSIPTAVLEFLFVSYVDFKVSSVPSVKRERITNNKIMITVQNHKMG